MIRQGFVVLSMLGLVGCAHFDSPNDPNFAPVMPEVRKPLTPDMGSIYHPGLGLSLYEDIKAHQIGDIITVIFNEKMDASKSADSKLKKESDATILNPTLLGTTADFSLPKQLPIPLSTTDNLNLATSIDAKREFKGEADAAQKNKLTGKITVMVTQVLPNGNLYVRGEKWININHGDEFIRVAGIVRPQDIHPDNTIESDRIADARISYSGRGSLTNTSKPGWITKIVSSSLWPL
ncbi:flagellar basal body L-ring protein FlgH [Candidatus Berkiella cookevillensis]|uniref:Flagellar L-ring protein n=1 Tax=Candidatus Berkiella cookevillensis TaxID=437022 RepID=A0A0Q9YT79_9GAMM|nr:flagellar basal body L-ring protein FlgH [Candidatus Berkiella cookevillensis]MCS5708624.1 flagellar basal body L-ring protein FlgH [Candidatus Berkiella cookevillensis]